MILKIGKSRKSLMTLLLSIAVYAVSGGNAYAQYKQSTYLLHLQFLTTL